MLPGKGSLTDMNMVDMLGGELVLWNSGTYVEYSGYRWERIRKAKYLPSLGTYLGSLPHDHLTDRPVCVFSA